jgi:rRNA maturation RNase YbeY
LKRELGRLIAFLDLNKAARPASRKAAGAKGYPEIRLAFLRPSQIRSIKKKHLHEDHITDVLSFPDETGGDIAVCPQRVMQDAHRDGRDRGEYLAEVLLHGILHLRGLKHDYRGKTLARLWDKQGKILKACGIRFQAFKEIQPD